MDAIGRKHQTSSDDSPITFLDDIIEEIRNITKSVSTFSMIWHLRKNNYNLQKKELIFNILQGTRRVIHLSMTHNIQHPKYVRAIHMTNISVAKHKVLTLFFLQKA
jgi:hypothetical protein